MNLKEAVQQSKLGYRGLAQAVRLSKTVVHRIINYGEYPFRLGEAETQRRFAAVLHQHGVNIDAIEWPASGIRPGCSGAHRMGRLRTAASANQDMPSLPEAMEAINLMQLDRSVLQLFGLRTNPFLNDVETDEDVFPYKAHETVTTAIRDAIEQRGFLAVCAPSGAGKTTIWDGIESEYGGRDDVIICKPQVKAKDQLTPEHLANALLYGLLGNDAHIAREAERRGRMLSSALRLIRAGSVDKRAVLYIDDAHFCTASVLRQLKTFYEEKIGRFRLLSIILGGLPELKNKLAAFPEIGNRIRLVEVPPVPVEDYLRFKLRRVGSQLEKVFDPTGLQAFLDRFRVPRRPALGYPLIVNASCIQAMVRLHMNGAQPGERITREIVDMLPYGASLRRSA